MRSGEVLLQAAGQVSTTRARSNAAANGGSIEAAMQWRWEQLRGRSPVRQRVLFWGGRMRLVALLSGGGVCCLTSGRTRIAARPSYGSLLAAGRARRRGGSEEEERPVVVVEGGGGGGRRKERRRRRRLRRSRERLLVWCVEGREVVGGRKSKEDRTPEPSELAAAGPAAGRGSLGRPLQTSAARSTSGKVS